VAALYFPYSGSAGKKYQARIYSTWVKSVRSCARQALITFHLQNPGFASASR